MLRIYYANRTINTGLLALLVALLSGFLLIFKMIGGMSLNPLPVFFPFELIGDVNGWRILHVGMMMNGIMAVGLGCVMRMRALADHKASLVSWGILIAVWGNFCFYLFGMFAPNHGVTMEANRLGEASLAGVLAFLPAFIGAVTLIYAVAVLWRAEEQS